MKKRIISALLVVLTMLSCISFLALSTGAQKADIVNSDMTREQACLDHMTYVATSENGVYELYVAEEEEITADYEVSVGEIGIKNTITGEIMLSNPSNTSSINATGVEKYRSQLSFRYINLENPSSVLPEEFSVTAGKTTIKIENGKITVDYYFGIDPEEELMSDLVLPERISYETWMWMQEQKALLEESGYKFPGTTKSQFKNLYIKSLYATDDISYMLEESLSDYLSLSIKKMTGDTSYQSSIENSIWMLNSKVVANDSTKKNYSSVLEALGFTKEMMEEEYEKIGHVEEETEESTIPKFRIPITYEITNDGFVANVDTKNVEMDENGYITSITILPFMSAANKDSHGYSFVPDGSGVILRFEDVTANVSKPVYGHDFAYYNINTSEKNSEQIIFPVFGMVETSKANGIGYFAIIEKGDTLATIESRNDTHYHSMTSSFSVGYNDKFDLADAFSSSASSSKNVYVHADDIYRGDLTVKYTLLVSNKTKEQHNVTARNGFTPYDVSYVGMASCYRDYLTNKGVLTKIDSSAKNTRLFLETFGAILRREKFLTFPVTVYKTLTTFEDIKNIYDELSADGIDNINFIMTGFANGGLKLTYPTKMQWLNKLGGEKGFEALAEYAKEKGFDLSPYEDFSYARDFYAFSGMRYSKNASRTLDNRYTTSREYDSSYCIFMRTGAVVMSSGSFEIAYNKFISSAGKYSLTSLAPRSFGSDLNSDFNEDGILSREDSKANVVNILSKFAKDNGYKLVLDKGNAYSLAYANAILNAGIDSSMLSGVSETIPFTGLVLHGSLEFAGKAINTEGDERYALLKALENGSTLYFTIVKDNAYTLKSTMRYNQYYSISYDILKNQITELYKEYNSVMKTKQNQYITEHEFLNAKFGFDVTRIEDGAALNNSRVVRVQYENGEGFILNYNSYAINVTYNGTTYEIAPLSYVAYSK